MDEFEEKTTLIESIRNNNERLARVLIDAGADCNEADNEGKTALIYAVLNNNESSARVLIDARADCNEADNEGRTALLYAVLNNNESLARVLIDAGADCNEADNEGKTALIYAVQNKNERLAVALIDARSDVNIIDDDFRTALSHAVYSDQDQIALALINAGTTVNLTDIDNKSSLIHAILNENELLTDALINAGSDVNITDNEYKTALIYSVQNENEALTRALIKADCDVNITDNEDKTALIHAIQRHSESIALALIEAGTDVNSTDEQHMTALIHSAKDKNGYNLSSALIKAGADVNITDNYQKSALIHAVICKVESTCVALIEAGANVNIPDVEYKTALIYSVKNEMEHLARVLIEAGADVSLIDNEGQNALFCAVGNVRVLRQFVENVKCFIDSRDVYGRSPLFYAFTKSFASAKYLIDKGGNLCIRDNCDLSILSFFIDDCLLNKSDESTHISDGINLLIQHRVPKKTVFTAIINVVFCKILSSTSLLPSIAEALTLARNYKQDDTTENIDDAIEKILLIIMERKSDQQSLYTWGANIKNILALLIDLGANPNSVDSDGNTALHYATCLSLLNIPEKTTMELCIQLQIFGVSFNIKNHNGETPLLFCLSKVIYGGNANQVQQCAGVEILTEVCRFLLKHGASVEETTKQGESSFHLVLKMFHRGLSISNEESGQRILNEAQKLLQLIVHVTRGFTVNRRSTNLNSPLHIWASLKLNSTQEYGSIIFENYNFEQLLRAIFKRLLDCGVQLNARNSHDETPLHVCKTWSAVVLLLDAGANPKDMDSGRRTPLLVAARNTKFIQSSDHIYPDVLVDPKVFWNNVIEKGLNPWAIAKNGESVLSILIKSECFVLAKALLEVTCKRNYIQKDKIAVSILINICRDRSTRVFWKTVLVKMILKSRKRVVCGKVNQDSPLHCSCRNIVRESEYSNGVGTKTSVHWTIARLLLSFGADCNIPDKSGMSCLDIASKCPELKELLLKPVNIKDIPLLIPWTSVSTTHAHKLNKVARRQECDHTDSLWYHKEHLQSGSFGLVFAGINERDGREVAIKRLEKLRMQKAEDKREIANLTALADCEQVIRYMSFHEDEHFCYVVLELMEGNLEEYLDGTFDMGKCVLLCKDVVTGLKYLHGQNILHRDLKPSNILYKTHPKLCFKIADFGLSRRIDSIESTTVYGTNNVGSGRWIAPELLKSANSHSKPSDIFSCGLVFHYILSAKRHPFVPAFSDKKSPLQIVHIQSNILKNNMEGWDNSLCPEASHLVGTMLEFDPSIRPTAADALSHPYFWSNKKKMEMLTAVGNQPEIECPRAKRSTSLTAVETDLENIFDTVVKHTKWDDPRYVQMPDIYAQMAKKRKYPYNTYSVVELVRFMRNAIAHVSEDNRPTPIRKMLLEKFLFLEYFPNLVMEVYKVVTTHGWDKTREEVIYAIME